MYMHNKSEQIHGKINNNINNMILYEQSNQENKMTYTSIHYIS